MVALEDALREALANLREAIEQSGAEVTWSALPCVRGSRGNLVQLFQNLVGNALKFHGAGPPRVQVRGERDESGGWCVEVRDHGPGVPPEDRERVFEVFERGRNGASSPGSGIGLAIVQRVVQQLGGRAWVDAAPGGGARFRFSVPADHVARPDEASQ